MIVRKSLIGTIFSIIIFLLVRTHYLREGKRLLLRHGIPIKLWFELAVYCIFFFFFMKITKNKCCVPVPKNDEKFVNKIVKKMYCDKIINLCFFLIFFKVLLLLLH